MTTTRVAIVSGGMDSVTLAHMVRHEYPHDRLVLVSFHYGQRHQKELGCAQRCAERLDAEWRLLQLPRLAGSALTDQSRDIPEGHYAAENMAQTVVPNRNMVMLSHAAAIAVEVGARTLYTGVHAGDHAIYPDCRPEFIRAVAYAIRVGNEGHIDPEFFVEARFVHDTKADIVRHGDRLGVPWTDTWSCYKGGEHHCGRCGTCEERAEAFALAGVPDPTVYSAEPTLRAAL